MLGTYAYDDLGRRTGLTRGNGATTSWSYDNVSRLTGLSHNLAGTASDVTFAYAYDPAGGIVSTTRDNDAYAYTGLANANVSSTVNGLNRITATGGSALSYDGRGNVIAVPAAASATGAAASYDYLAENRLVHGPNGAAFIPDPLGRLFVALGGIRAAAAPVDSEAEAWLRNGYGNNHRLDDCGPLGACRASYRSDGWRCGSWHPIWKEHRNLGDGNRGSHRRDLWIRHF